MSVQSSFVLVTLRALGANVVPRLHSIHRVSFLDRERRVHEASSGQMPLQMALRRVRTVAEVASIFPDPVLPRRSWNTKVTVRCIRDFNYDFLVIFSFRNLRVLALQSKTR